MKPRVPEPRGVRKPGERLTDTYPALWDGERPLVERLAPSFLGEHNFEVYSDVEEIGQGIVGNLFG